MTDCPASLTQAECAELQALEAAPHDTTGDWLVLAMALAAALIWIKTTED